MMVVNAGRFSKAAMIAKLDSKPMLYIESRFGI
jgi:hypothetical protein